MVVSTRKQPKKRNPRSQQGNPNHKPFEYASDWKDHVYVSHFDFPEYAACGETGAVIKFEKNGEKKTRSYYTCPDQYFGINVRRKTLIAHRFVFECLTEERLGKDDLIDHKNGKRKDNTITNLVKSNPVKNARNCKLNSNNTSGNKGVREMKRGGKKWEASINNNEGKQRFAFFLTKKEAIEQRKKWEKEYGGYNTTERSDVDIDDRECKQLKDEESKDSPRVQFEVPTGIGFTWDFKTNTIVIH